MTTITTTNIASLIGVTPRSERSRFVVDSLRTQAAAEVRRCTGLPIAQDWYQVLSAAILVAHVTSTGRIHGATLCDYRELSAYRVCKVVARVAATYRSDLSETDQIDLVRSAIAKEVK